MGTVLYCLEGLCLGDSSIMPSVTTRNLSAPTIMLVEKAADDIMGKGTLAAEDALFYAAANWRVAQRQPVRLLPYAVRCGRL